jgi:hypothetical protein
MEERNLPLNIIIRYIYNINRLLVPRSLLLVLLSLACVAGLSSSSDLPSQPDTMICYRGTLLQRSLMWLARSTSICSSLQIDF